MKFHASLGRAVGRSGTEILNGRFEMNDTTMARFEPKTLARMAGLFYVLLVIAGGFAHVFIRGKVYIADNPAETARLVAENAGLVRAGVLIDLVGALAFLMVGLTLHQLLKHVNQFVARVMVTLVAIAVAMTCLNLIFQYGGVLLATKDAYTGGVGAGELDTSILFMFDLQFYGYVLVQAFTGPWLMPFAWLAVRSGLFPRALGGLLAIGGVSYLTDLIVQILDPALAEKASEAILAPAIVAEVSAIGYLLVKGASHMERRQLG